MEKEVVWIDGRDPRLGLCGCAGGEAYCRFSAEEREALKKVNPDEAYLSTNPAGVMLRFFTDSSIVAVRGKVERPSDMTHMPASGQSGFDLYVRDSRVGGYAFRGNVRPAAGSVDFEGEFPSFAESTGKSCLLYLPLYNGVERLEVGLQAGSECASEKFKGGKIAVYGTSIAQGGCVSRPGMLFTSILSRALEKEVLNYGFSGSAFAEREIAEIIAKRGRSSSRSWTWRRTRGWTSAWRTICPLFSIAILPFVRRSRNFGFPQPFCDGFVRRGSHQAPSLLSAVAAPPCRPLCARGAEGRVCRRFFVFSRQFHRIYRGRGASQRLRLRGARRGLLPSYQKGIGSVTFAFAAKTDSKANV